MAVYGYARVSIDGQTLASQDAQLIAAGCGQIFKEKVSGARTDRVELAKLMKRIEAGDLLIVTRLDRLARSIVPIEPRRIGGDDHWLRQGQG